MRYTAWCQRCEHGLSAFSSEETAALARERAGARRRREAAGRRAEELEAGLAKVGNLRPGGPVRAEMAARVAGTDAALSLLRKLAIGRSVQVFVHREKARRGRVVGLRAPQDAEEGPKVWTDLAAFLAAVPEHEYQRQARVSEVRGTAADDSHPADYLRTRFLRGRPPLDRALTLSDEEWEAVEQELYPYVAAAGATLVR